MAGQLECLVLLLRGDPGGDPVCAQERRKAEFGAAASWLLAQETLPRHQTTKLLGDDFRVHLEQLIPKVEQLAEGGAQGGRPAMIALAAAEEARRRLGEAERPGLRGEVERVKLLARSVMTLREHHDVLVGDAR
ncbi:DUF6415 family natural product biosynthesis protein [Streptomyces sp. NPDC005820]|uniref:DUF6415 family natural product biosynthesis protein n=1 Tax=Streptomyces sp. NPDC005820 TaxID=3157069 RepID=UPI0033CDFBC2